MGINKESLEYIKQTFPDKQSIDDYEKDLIYYSTLTESQSGLQIIPRRRCIRAVRPTTCFGIDWFRWGKAVLMEFGAEKNYHLV